jgi:hypothetical protein
MHERDIDVKASTARKFLGLVKNSRMLTKRRVILGTQVR